MPINQLRSSSLFSPKSQVFHFKYNQTLVLFPEFVFFLNQSQAIFAHTLPLINQFPNPILKNTLMTSTFQKQGIVSF